MSGIDIAIVGIAILAVLLVGLWPSRLDKDEAFLISDRKLGGFSSGFTIAASKIGGGLLVTYSSLVFAFGHSAIWLFVGYTVGYILFYFFAIGIQGEAHENKYYTMADFFEKRFGRSAGLGVGLACVVSLSGWIFTNLIAGGALVGSISGLNPVVASSILATVIGIYLCFGGFHSVVRTDVIQFVAFLGILIGITIALSSEAVEKNVSLNEITSVPVGQIISFFLLGALFPLGSAELWQRTYATKDRRSLLMGVGIASVSFIGLGVVLSLVCLQLMRVEVEGAQSAADLGLANGVSAALPDGFVGIWTVAFLMAVISSADTFVFTTASALFEDVVERIGWAEKSRRTHGIKVSVVLLCVLGVVGAALFKSIVSVAFFFAGVTMSLGVVSLLSWFRAKLTGWSICAALSIGVLLSALQGFFQGVSGTTALVNAGATLVVLLLGSLAGPKRETR